MGVENSLLLLAIKRMASDSAKSYSYFGSYHSTSSVSVDTVDLENMPEYINIMVEENTEFLGAKSDIKDNLKSSLEAIAKQIARNDKNAQRQVSIHNIYDKKKGELKTFGYVLTPAGKDSINVETISLNVKFQLKELIVIITTIYSKNSGPSTTTEVQYIPASVNIEDVITALSIAVNPLVRKTDKQISSELVDDLIKMAAKIPDRQPEDKDRRTVVDPTTKMAHEIRDPSIFHLIPTKWRYIRSRDLIAGFKRVHTSAWSFDE